jgi:hypothetical protein
MNATALRFFGDSPRKTERPNTIASGSIEPPLVREAAMMQAHEVVDAEARDQQ